MLYATLHVLLVTARKSQIEVFRKHLSFHHSLFSRRRLSGVAPRRPRPGAVFQFSSPLPFIMSDELVKLVQTARTLGATPHALVADQLEMLKKLTLIIATPSTNMMLSWPICLDLA